MHRAKKEGFHLKTIDKIGSSYLIASIGFSLVTTIWAIYLESFVHNASYVGFLTTLFTIVAISSYFLLIPIVEKSSKTKLLFIAMGVFIFSHLLFSIYSNFYLVVFLGILLAVAASLRVTSFGILVRDKTKSKDVSKNEGIVYTLLNVAWLVGPLIAGYLSQNYGFKPVFFFAAICVLISLALFKFFKIKDTRKSKRIDHNILKVLVEFFKNKERTVAYVISGTVNFWWALIYIYIPIRIIEQGLGDFTVGIFLAAVVVPLILFEYYFGKLAGRKGFKGLFFFGFLIMSVSASLCFFIPNLYLVLVILSLASIGVSMVESTTEAYFFDCITKNQRDRYYGPYNTAVDTGYFFGVLPSAIILLFLPFNYLFLFFGVITLAVALFSLKIKDAIECRRH